MVVDVFRHRHDAALRARPAPVSRPTPAASANLVADRSHGLDRDARVRSSIDTTWCFQGRSSARGEPIGSEKAHVQPANNFLANHRASLARCGPSTSDPATAPSNSTTSARAVAFGSFTPAAFVHSRKRSMNHSR
jgi:hypothetical protein